MPRASLGSFARVAVCVGLANLFFAHRVSAEPVAMRCVDADGKPVAGAEIHLFQYDRAASRYVASGPFTSDDQGRAAGEKEVFSNDAGNFDRWMYARIPGQCVGVARSAKWTNQKPFNPDGKILLVPSKSVEGQIAVPEGFDVRKVTVRARVMHVSTGPDVLDYESFSREDGFPGLDTALAEIFERQPGPRGEFQFDDVPVRGQLFLKTEAAGLAEAQWRNLEQRFEEPIEMALKRECVISGRILSPDGKPAGGVTVAARLLSGPGVTYSASFRAVSNLKGEYSIRGLPQAIFHLTLVESRRQWMMRPRESLKVPVEGTLELDLQLEQGVLISGQIFDPEGKPVAGAAISAVTDSQSVVDLADDVSDAAGRYKLRVPSGKARLYFNSLPDGFVYPRPQILKNLDITSGQADIEKLDFTLSRKAAAE